LHHVAFDLVDREWRTAGGGGSGSLTAPEILATEGVGLHRLGGSSRDPVRFTLAIASPEVISIELRSDRGVLTRRPGTEGFCLFGVTDSDPITHARAIDKNGQALPGEPLLL
jgi:hypothetical protein